MTNTIKHFIAQFRGAEDCFSYGMCYWFAEILYHRFRCWAPRIMYADIDNHFGCEIDGIVYDVTGDVTDKYDWEDWKLFQLKDELHTQRIIRDCILKMEVNDYDV